MTTQTLNERRLALAGLETKLTREVVNPINAAWTPAVTDAAKSVTDLWPDRLNAATTQLQQAFAAYRPLVEVPAPGPRGPAVERVEASAAALDAELDSCVAALVEAKPFKSDAQKQTIDDTRDTLNAAKLALTSWLGDFCRFDASVPSSPALPPSTGKPPGEATPTGTSLANNTPFPVVLTAKIADPRDWASTTARPDRSFCDTPLAPFGSLEAQADLASARRSASVTMTAKIASAPPQTLTFTYDQRAALGSATLRPLGPYGSQPSFVVSQSTTSNAAGLPTLRLILTQGGR